MAKRPQTLKPSKPESVIWVTEWREVKLHCAQLVKAAVATFTGQVVHKTVTDSVVELNMVPENAAVGSESAL